MFTTNGAYWLKQRRLIQPGFHRKKLQVLFLSHKDILLPPTSKLDKIVRNQLIEEAWLLVRLTEEVGTIRVSNGYLQDLVAWIGENSAKFPLIWELLSRDEENSSNNI